MGLFNNFLKILGLELNLQKNNPFGMAFKTLNHIGLGYSIGDGQQMVRF